MGALELEPLTDSVSWHRQDLLPLCSLGEPRLFFVEWVKVKVGPVGLQVLEGRTARL